MSYQTERKIEVDCRCGAIMHGASEAEVVDWYQRHSQVCAAMADKMANAMKDSFKDKGGKN